MISNHGDWARWVWLAVAGVFIVAAIVGPIFRAKGPTENLLRPLDETHD